jgi:hypothetical protein
LAAHTPLAISALDLEVATYHIMMYKESFGCCALFALQLANALASAAVRN